MFIIKYGPTSSNVPDTLKEKFYIVEWDAVIKPRKYITGEANDKKHPFSIHPFDVAFDIINDIKESTEKVIIFVKKKKLARNLCAKLLMLNYKVGFLHG